MTTKRISYPDDVIELFESIKDSRNLRFYIKHLSPQSIQWLENTFEKLATSYWFWLHSGKQKEIDWPTCKNCGKPIDQTQIIRDGIRKYCSRTCGGLDPKRREIARQSLLQTYQNKTGFRNEQ